ncbi:MAG: ATP-binding protein [Leptolyngbya sp. BL-A-14]
MNERAADQIETDRVEKDVLKDLFASSGEMGRRIQAFNWADTAIGPAETWSQSLQIALQILLLSKFPMQILWGKEYVQFYNDAYIAIAGNKHPTALGQRGEDCWREVWDFAGPLLDQVMTTGTATWSEDQLLVLNRYGSPEECYFTFSYTPIWEKSGKVGGIFIAVNETTQKILSARRERELRLETQAAMEAAERANHLKDQFLAVLSHELRSPLNPILGWTSLLLNRELDADTTRRGLEAIERNARLQAQMIDDLLDVSRILREKLALTIAPVYLIPIIEDAIETVQATATSKGIPIHTQFDRAPLQMMGDANRLKQLIWNLLSNAVKFTPSGGQVTVRLTYTDTSALLQVSDTGKGISADFLPHVFDHFRQEDSTTTRVFGGLGLGLAIAKQIADMHEGSIQAESLGEGAGATFTVKLPLPTHAAVAIEQAKESPHSEGLQALQVLVVEDEVDNRELLVFTLKMYGATVTAVASAADAIKQLSQCQPDVIISDIGMAEIDGYTLIQSLRENPQTNHIPAIALTAYVGEADQQQALKAGFQAHLPKPMDPIQLVETILKVMSSSRAT